MPIPGGAGSVLAAGQPAPVGPGADHARTDRRGHRHQPRRHRHQPGQLRITLRGQQFHQPGPAAVLRQHPVRPAGRLPRRRIAVVRRPRRGRLRRPRLRFADEYPANQYRPDDPALRATLLYPRGTVVMATEGPNTNGSQFPLIFHDSEMDPQSTVLGTIDPAGLATLDKIARAGIAGNRPSGPPANPVTITSVRIG
ncbi:peptidylprolyl isomerase [Mycobacterium avium]|uniref:peptidylprolyl isomerase n=1 Tax=Mycobacterium avium TaxID=1764 RepID=UPI003F69344D